MKTRVIVHCLTMSSLLVWIVICDFSVTDAGGPPIRLAVDRQATGRADESEDEFAGTTQLIPTQWDRSPELIPTDLDQQKVQWVRRRGLSVVPGDDYGPIGSGVSGGALNELLDRQISQSQWHPVKTAPRDDHLTVVAPWFVGERPSGATMEIKSVIRFDPTQFGRTKALHPFEVEDRWMPADQWWPRLLVRQKSTY